ncbi:type VI secretion system-associated FHA domain protein TagH [Ramlibacter sp. XY19]|uniref:type VI secretion system-associated FHA domain protein TagH n=1 Tax=Ramlibacter paludis TaxID=2908000 RepID=UPI0023DBB6C8|nr:type VI secretion system-associated FHA domain protein TagH [Ramlibacter paludis]
MVLQPAAPPLDVGRDAQAGVYLPDNDRLISRRHCTLEWDQGGVKVTVLSKVNGITTPRGEFNIGQSVVIPPGESAQLGRYTFVCERGGAGAGAPAMAAPAAMPAPADDPFQVFGGAAAPAGSNSVFDDPFFNTPARAPAPALDMPAALDAMSGRPAHGGASFSGAAPGAELDPLAAFGGSQPPAHSSVSIDEFLGGAGNQPRGLGAAQMLRPESEGPARKLATDHVHDFNLPLRPMNMQPVPPPAPTAPLADDPLAALDALAAFGAPPATAAPRAAAAPAPSAAPAAPAAKSADPWADFASEWVPPGGRAKDKPAPQAPLNHAFDDAFSSSTAWHVEDMPDTVVDPLASASFESDKVLNAAFSVPPPTAAPSANFEANAAALQALCKGLGIGGPRQLSDAEWEHLGQSIRQIVQGLSDLMNVRAELKREMRAADRTMLGAQENNPLKSSMPMDELLHYLLFMPQGAAGYMPVPRALAESITDLRAHEFASLAAVRAVVEGSIKEFDPAKLRATLMKGKRSIATAIDNARLWDLYTTHYEDKGQHMADWLEQVFNRHFMPAYTREADRLRREAQSQQPPAQPTPPPHRG